MRRILALLRTSVGRKILMAVTGVLLLGLHLAHAGQRFPQAALMTDQLSKLPEKHDFEE